MCYDDDTRLQKSTDVARVLILSNCALVINDFLKVKINDGLFLIKIFKDSFSRLRLVMLELRANREVEYDYDHSFDSWSGFA